MLSSSPLGIVASVASLLAAILNHGNPDMNHKHWNTVEYQVRDILYNRKVHNEKIEITSYFNGQRELRCEKDK